MVEKKKVVKKIANSNLKENSKEDTKNIKSIKTTKVTKNKKEYPKFGQTKNTPKENDPLRIFYTSLLKQNKNSEMAYKWCFERGLLEGQEDNLYIKMDNLTIDGPL